MSTEQEKARELQLKWANALKIYNILYCIVSAGLVIYIVRLLAQL